MKVALVFSGHLRGFEKTFQSIEKSILKPFSPDVFFHLWDSIGVPTAKGNTDRNFLVQKSGEKVETIQSLYNPKEVVIEEDITPQFIQAADHIPIPADQRKWVPDHLGCRLSMFYKIYKGNLLRKEYEEKNNIKYDLIIRCRTDLLFTTELKPHLFQDENCLYSPIIGKYLKGGINDQFAIAHPSIMDTYCSLYPDLLSYMEKSVTVPRPEAYLGYHLKKNKIKIKHMNIMYYICRLNGAIVVQDEWSQYWK